MAGSLPTRNQIVEALTVLQHLKEERGKQSFIDDDDLYLVYELHKIPVSNTTNRINIPLHHLPNRQSACLIVADGDLKDREEIPKVIQKWQDKLDKAGVTEITEVLPILKLKLEYSSHELRRKLSSQYDVFLAERSVMRLLPSYLGKSFFSPSSKKFPIQVGYKSYNLKQETSRALKCVVGNVSLRGSSNSVIVGEFDMNRDLLADNVEAAVKALAGRIPGGQENIRSFHLKLCWSDSLPIFTSTVDRATVQVPVCNKPVPNKPISNINQKKSKKRVNSDRQFEEVSTIKGKVHVSRDGLVLISKPGGQMKAVIGGSYRKAGIKRKLGGLEQEVQGGKKAKTTAESRTPDGKATSKKAKADVTKDKAVIDVGKDKAADLVGKAATPNSEKPTQLSPSKSSSMEENKPLTPKSRKRSRKRRSVVNAAGETPEIKKTVNMQQTPAKIPRTEKTPGKTPKTGKTPGKTPKTEKTPGKAPITEKTPGITTKTEKTPGKPPITEKVPGDTHGTEKTPGKAPNAEKISGKSPKTDKTPGKSPKTDKTPGKRPKTDKTPGKTPKTGKTPGKTPKTGKTPKLVKSLGSTPKLVKSPGKTPQFQNKTGKGSKLVETPKKLIPV